MTNLTSYPLIDYFETTLAQAWDGATGTVYLNDTPDFTFPSNTTTLITVNPGRSNQQAAIINAVDTGANTVTVSSISVNKGASVAYTQQSHAVGSVVRISNNYQFRENLKNAINSKIDGIVQGVYFYADTTARNAALGATPSTDGLVAGLTAEGKVTYSLGGSWLDWSTSSSTFVNASTTVAGKVEIGTAAELTAGTATGGTGASLVATPDVIQASIQKGEALYGGASAAGNDTYAVSLTPALTAYTTGATYLFKADVANTGACTLNINSLGAKNIKTLDGNDPQTGAIRANQIVEVKYDGTNMVLQNEDIGSTTNKGIYEMSTDAEVVTGTDETRVTNAKQVRTYSNTTFGTNSRGASDASGDQTIAHGLGVTPRIVEFRFVKSEDAASNAVTGVGVSNGSNNYCIGNWDVGATNDPDMNTSYCMLRQDSSGNGHVATATMDATNITVSRTKGGTGSGSAIDYIWIAHA